MITPRFLAVPSYIVPKNIVNCAAEERGATDERRCVFTGGTSLVRLHPASHHFPEHHDFLPFVARRRLVSFGYGTRLPDGDWSRLQSNGLVREEQKMITEPEELLDGKVLEIITKLEKAARKRPTKFLSTKTLRSSPQNSFVTIAATEKRRGSRRWVDLNLKVGCLAGSGRCHQLTSIYRCRTNSIL